MRKSWKQPLSLLLCGAVIAGLAGCAGGNKGTNSGNEASSGQGRYVETEIKLSEGSASIDSITQNPEGKLELYGQNYESESRVAGYTVDDNGTAAEFTPDWVSLLPKSQVSVPVTEEGSGTEAEAGGDDTAAASGTAPEPGTGSSSAAPESAPASTGASALTVSGTSKTGIQPMMAVAESVVVPSGGGSVSFGGSGEAEGAEVEYTPPEWEMNVRRVKYGPDGNVYLSVYEYGTKFVELNTSEDQGPTGSRAALYKIENGELKDVTPQFTDDQREESDFGRRGDEFENFYVLEDGSLVLTQNYGPSSIFGPDGQLKATLGKESRAATVSGNQLVLAEEDASDEENPYFYALNFYDLESGEKTASVSLKQFGWLGNVYLAPAPENKVALCFEKGIYLIGPDSTGPELKVNGGLTSLNSPEIYINDFMALENGDYLVLASNNSQDNNGSNLYRYHYEADVPTEPSKKLTVLSMSGSDVVRKAITKMQAEDPDLYIQMQEMWSQDFSATQEDIIRSINTELIAGKGADIYLLDGLPVESYIEKGVLMDLSDLAVLNDCYTNIIRAYERDGKICAVPLRFTLPMIAGSSEFTSSVNSLNDLVTWSEAHRDPPLLYRMDWNMLLIRFLPVCAPAWLSNSGEIDDAKLSEFLTTIKRLSESGVERDEDDYFGGVFAVNANFAQVILEEIYGVDTFQEWRAAFSNTPSWDFKPLMGQLPEGQSVFTPQDVIGVNNNSKYPEIAKELVANLLSAEMQTDEFAYFGLPVRKDMLEKSMHKSEEELKNHSYGYGTTGPDGKQYSMNIEGGWITEEQIQRFLQICEGANVPYSFDFTLLQMIQEEIKPFFEGTKDVAAVVEAVKNRTLAYINE